MVDDILRVWIDDGYCFIDDNGNCNGDGHVVSDNNEYRGCNRFRDSDTHDDQDSLQEPYGIRFRIAEYNGISNGLGYRYDDGYTL